MLSLKFIDGTILKEPNLNWNTLPNVPIQWMQFNYYGHIIRLLGYSSYIRLKEMIYGVNTNINGCSKIILAAKINDLEADCITIDINKKTLAKTRVSIEQVYSHPINPTLWKKGQVSDNQGIYTICTPEGQ